MRHPKPFFRNFTKSWYVTIRGKQIPLGKDKPAAWQKYHELMASQPKFNDRTLTVAAVCDSYLQWLKTHRAPATYSKAVHYLSLFVKFVGVTRRVSSLDGSNVSDWIDQYSHWTSSTGNDAVSLVQRTLNWAVKRNYIAQSPVAFVPHKPRKTRREIVFSPTEWKELRALVKDQEFGDLVDFMWETGCRPQEARLMEARHLDLNNDMVVFPPSQAKGQQIERVIFLTDTAREICARLAAGQPIGPIMRNTKGAPWTKNSINCRFRRLRNKFKRPACAYAIRHSYATEGLKSGVDSLTLAQIMGHQDTSMIARTYSHLARNPDYLREQAKKLKAS